MTPKNESLKPPKPVNETARLEALQSYNILDTTQEEIYDDIVKLASYICDVPMAFMTLVDEDRQWFKAKVGIERSQTPRDEAFCAYAIHQSDVFIVSDPTRDERFKNNPLVLGNPNIRFYAGAPLTTSEGYGLGTLCVIDSKQRELTDDQLKALDTLRRQAVNHLEIRRKLLEQQKHQANLKVAEGRLLTAKKELDARNKEINDLSRILSHDMRAPMRGISSLVEWIFDDHRDELSEDLSEKLSLIKDRTVKLSQLLDGVVEYSKLGQMRVDLTKMDTRLVLDEALEITYSPPNITIDIEGEWPVIKADKSQILQIFQHLLSNAVQYQNKPNGLISIKATSDENNLVFIFMDNGIGISSKKMENIFELYGIARDSTNDQGVGIGLSMVKKNVLFYNGEILVESELGVGSVFKVLLPKTIMIR
jgi:signal transduction histidine kinase